MKVIFYETCENKTSDHLINSYGHTVLTCFHISLNAENKCIAPVGWLPRLYKNRTKARFVIVVPKCSLKTIYKFTTSVFRLLFQQIEIEDQLSSFFLGVESFWTILIPAIIDTIKNLNGRNKETSITGYDFSTIYPKILHGKLMRILNEHVDFCFKVSDGEFIVVEGFGAQWSSKQKAGSIFTGRSLKEALKYIP